MFLVKMCYICIFLSHDNVTGTFLCCNVKISRNVKHFITNYHVTTFLVSARKIVYCYNKFEV